MRRLGDVGVGGGGGVVQVREGVRQASAERVRHQARQGRARERQRAQQRRRHPRAVRRLEPRSHVATE